MAVATAPESRRSSVRGRARRVGLVVALWVFGVATTVMLIGVWGRAVATDESTLAASARAVVDSTVVADRITGWVAEGLAAAGALAPPDVAAAVAEIRDLPETRAAIDSLVEQSVAAAMATPGSEPEIDVSSALSPLAPVITTRLQSLGVEVTQPAVEAGLAGVGVLVLETQEDAGLAGVAVTAQTTLTRVVLVAGIVMLVAGGLVIALAEERLRMVRSLLTRVAVSAITFAFILRLGAWAVDPRGGRSPVAAGGSVLLRSNLWVLVAVATATGVTAAAGWVAARRRLDRVGVA